jgi:RNase P/RNase MRP subunit POP5
MRLKRLSSMREKKRYVTFKLHAEKPVIYSEMKGAVLNSILNWRGEEGFSAAKCRIIKNLWDEKGQTGWLQCSPGSVDDMKVSLALIHQIGDARVILQVLRVSGTIKSGKEKISGMTI